MCGEVCCWQEVEWWPHVVTWFSNHLLCTYPSESLRKGCARKSPWGFWHRSVWPYRRFLQWQFFQILSWHHSDITNGRNTDLLRGFWQWKFMSGWRFWQKHFLWQNSLGQPGGGGPAGFTLTCTLYMHTMGLISVISYGVITVEMVNLAKLPCPYHRSCLQWLIS